MRTLATLPAAPPFFVGAAAPFLPAFLDGAYIIEKSTSRIVDLCVAILTITAKEY